MLTGHQLSIARASRSEETQKQGLPTNDYRLPGRSSPELANKSARYTQMLQELQAGLNERAVHPGLSRGGLLVLEPVWVSQQAKDIAREEGFTLLDHPVLQAVWAGKRSDLRALACPTGIKEAIHETRSK